MFVLEFPKFNLYFNENNAYHMMNFLHMGARNELGYVPYEGGVLKLSRLHEHLELIFEKNDALVFRYITNDADFNAILDKWQKMMAKMTEMILMSKK